LNRSLGFDGDVRLSNAHRTLTNTDVNNRPVNTISTSERRRPDPDGMAQSSSIESNLITFDRDSPLSKSVELIRESLL